VQSGQKPTVGVIGCGDWGINHVRNFYQLGSLAMVADLSKERLHHVRSLAPETLLAADPVEVLRSPVTGIVIATPAETHYRLAMQAIEYGKDILVEKPLSLTESEGAVLLRSAAERGVVLMVGHVLEYHPAILKLLGLIRQGMLGKLQYIYSNRLSLGKVRKEENILWSFAPHDIAVILRIAGTMPNSLSALGASYVRPGIADVTLTYLSFDNGLRAHVHVSWLHPFKEQRLVVIGSLRMASFDDTAKRLVLYDQRVEIENEQAVSIKDAGRVVPFSEDEPLRLECAAFLEAMKTRKPPITDGHSALRVLRVLECAQKSLLRNGDSVAIP
jgi:predicted dehydrogenase